jgi:hypothetical protein
VGNYAVFAKEPVQHHMQRVRPVHLERRKVRAAMVPTRQDKAWKIHDVIVVIMRQKTMRDVLARYPASSKL